MLIRAVKRLGEASEQLNISPWICEIWSNHPVTEITRQPQPTPHLQPHSQHVEDAVCSGKFYLGKA